MIMPAVKEYLAGVLQETSQLQMHEFSTGPCLKWNRRRYSRTWTKHSAQQKIMQINV